MNRPLLVAMLGALMGFGGWIWLTGPGTSVPNAFLAFGAAILGGRLAWWLVPRKEHDDEVGTEPPIASPPATPVAAPAPAPLKLALHAPPPPGKTVPWRRSDREETTP
jgi:hypothetical protein